MMVDLLGRNKEVDNVLEIFRYVNESKKNYTLMINGEWGSGKSYLFNLLSEKLKAEKYCFLLNYNAWENDFYEEPAIGILATLVEQLDMFFRDTEITHGVLSLIKMIACGLIKTKWGVDVETVISNFQKGSDKGSCKVDDNFQSFKVALEKIRAAISELSEHYTIVVLVDELDRCLPEHAIKVLERMHHIFYKIPNCLILIAVDASQLNATVESIFGAHKNTEEYLRKFIDFQIQLELGNFQEKEFKVYYDDFLNYFEADSISVSQINLLFEIIPIRDRRRIMELCEIVHKVYIKEKCDFSVLYYELIWTTICYYKKSQNFNNYYTIPKDWMEFSWGKSLQEKIENYSDIDDRTIQRFNISSLVDTLFYYFVVLKHCVLPDFWCFQVGEHEIENRKKLQVFEEKIKFFL